MSKTVRTIAVFAFLMPGLIGLLIPTHTVAAIQKQPIIAIDSIQVSARTVTHHGKNNNVWSWVPDIDFWVFGPIPQGNVIYVDFSLSGGKSWMQFDCSSAALEEGYGRHVKCGSPRTPEYEDKGTLHTGPVNFAIKLRNELMGGDATLFAGRMKVAKAGTRNVDAPTKVVYYVDHDWNLPIGYIFYLPDDIQGWKLPYLNFAFWSRADSPESSIQPHLIYKGKPVAPGYCIQEVSHNTTHSADSLPKGARWARWACKFDVRGWDQVPEHARYSRSTPPYTLSNNLGEYEIKVLQGNRLARSLKFTVTADKGIDNGIREANKLALNNNRVIVPVQIIGDQDGPWDRNAWKIDAFYGHPLTGFTPPQ